MLEMASSSRVTSWRGGRVFSHGATIGVEAVQVCQCSEDKAAPIVLESGRKGESGDRPRLLQVHDPVQATGLREEPS